MTGQEQRALAEPSRGGPVRGRDLKLVLPLAALFAGFFIAPLLVLVAMSLASDSRAYTGMCTATPLSGSKPDVSGSSSAPPKEAIASQRFP